MANNNVLFKMDEDDLSPEIVTNQVLAIIEQWFNEDNIQQNDVQKTMMASHIAAMVNRAKTHESLPNVDTTLF